MIDILRTPILLLKASKLVLTRLGLQCQTLVFNLKVKTFALCQFRKLKFQKLCFLPPNIILGLKKSESINYFGSEKNFGPEKI